MQRLGGLCLSGELQWTIAMLPFMIISTWLLLPAGSSWLWPWIRNTTDIYYSPPYSLEIGFLTESGARSTATNLQWPCLYPSTPLHPVPNAWWNAGQHFIQCWRFEFPSLGLHSEHVSPLKHLPSFFSLISSTRAGASRVVASWIIASRRLSWQKSAAGYISNFSWLSEQLHLGPSVFCLCLCLSPSPFPLTSLRSPSIIEF